MTSVEIVSERYRIFKEIADLQARHRDQLRELELQLSELKNKCTEHDWIYYPDPSGNHDSCYCCQHCGKEVRRLPK